MSFCVVASYRVASSSVASHGQRPIAPHALLHRVEHASSSMRRRTAPDAGWQNSRRRELPLHAPQVKKNIWDWGESERTGG